MNTGLDQYMDIFKDAREFNKQVQNYEMFL